MELYSFTPFSSLLSHGTKIENKGHEKAYIMLNKNSLWPLTRVCLINPVTLLAHAGVNSQNVNHELDFVSAFFQSCKASDKVCVGWRNSCLCAGVFLKARGIVWHYSAKGSPGVTTNGVTLVTRG